MRKVLSKKGTLVAVLSLALIGTGCSAAWLSTLDSILAAAAPALINILQIVAIAEGKPANSILVSKINADTTLIKTLAVDFSTASNISGPGACQQLQAAVGVYQRDIQLVLEAAQVSDPNTQAKISSLAALVAGTVSAIAAVIPACQSGAAVQAPNAELQFSVSTFVNDYNRILAEKTGNAVVDAATTKLKLRRHSKFVSVATFGRLR
jgi:hypothetical protein